MFTSWCTILVLSSSAMQPIGVERLACEMIYCIWSGMLNCSHSLAHFDVLSAYSVSQLKWHQTWQHATSVCSAELNILLTTPIILHSLLCGAKKNCTLFILQSYQTVFYFTDTAVNFQQNCQNCPPLMMGVSTLPSTLPCKIYHSVYNHSSSTMFSSFF